MDGIFFRGECMGIKSKPAFNEGDEPTLEVGVSVPKVGGFPGEIAVLAARLTKEQTKAGIQHRINKMIGQRIELAVELNQGKTETGRSYSHYRVAGDPHVIDAGKAAPQPAAVSAVK